MSLEINNNTKSAIPKVDFAAIKKITLGDKYSLSISIVNSSYMRRLNRQYRNIDRPTDILSFPISDDTGEIYISISDTRQAAKKFDMEYEKFFEYLIIHGCSHLKGYDHGYTMDKYEKKIIAHVSNNNHRN